MRLPDSAQAMNKHWQDGFSEACKQICQQAGMEYTTCVHDIAAGLLSKRRERARACAENIAEIYQDESSPALITLLTAIILRHWTKTKGLP